MKEGILLCGHGTRREAGVKSFKRFVAILKERYQDVYEVDYGFLEFNHPTYEMGSVKFLLYRLFYLQVPMPKMIFLMN